MIFFRVLFVDSYDEQSKFTLIFVSNNVEYLIFIIINHLFNFLNFELFIYVHYRFLVDIETFGSIWKNESFLWIIGLEKQRVVC